LPGADHLTIATLLPSGSASRPDFFWLPAGTRGNIVFTSRTTLSKGATMSLTIEQLAELLAGIARSQQAIIDAIEKSESGGWRNTHLLPKVTVAANLRLKDARLIDLPSRILLRSQSRVPMDTASIARDLQTALGGAGAVSTAAATPAPAAEQQGGDLDFMSN
jgi:hypothetical protein